LPVELSEAGLIGCWSGAVGKGVIAMAYRRKQHQRRLYVARPRGGWGQITLDQNSLCLSRGILI